MGMGLRDALLGADKKSNLATRLNRQTMRLGERLYDYPAIVPQYMAEGGDVGPPMTEFGAPMKPKGTDTVPVMATEGEFMFPKDVVQYYGTKKLHDMVNKAKEEAPAQPAPKAENGVVYAETQGLIDDPNKKKIDEEYNNRIAGLPDLGPTKNFVSTFGDMYAQGGKNFLSRFSPASTTPTGGGVRKDLVVNTPVQGQPSSFDLSYGEKRNQGYGTIPAFGLTYIESAKNAANTTSEVVDPAVKYLFGVPENTANTPQVTKQPVVTTGKEQATTTNKEQATTTNKEPVVGADQQQAQTVAAPEVPAVPRNIFGEPAIAGQGGTFFVSGKDDRNNNKPVSAEVLPWRPNDPEALAHQLPAEQYRAMVGGLPGAQDLLTENNPSRGLSPKDIITTMIEAKKFNLDTQKTLDAARVRERTRDDEFIKKLSPSVINGKQFNFVADNPKEAANTALNYFKSKDPLGIFLPDNAEVKFEDPWGLGGPSSGSITADYLDEDTKEEKTYQGPLQGYLNMLNNRINKYAERQL